MSAQYISKHVFEFEDIETPLSHMNKVDIFQTAIGSYFEQLEIEQNLAHPVGYIVKFIEITDSSAIFSLSYFNMKRYLNNYKPFYYYAWLIDKPVLFTRSDSISKKFDNFMDNLRQGKFTEKIYEKIKFPESGISISVDCYFEGVAIYKNEKLTLTIYPDNKTPLKYKPQRDDYLINLKKHFEYYDKYFLKKDTINR